MTKAPANVGFQPFAGLRFRDHHTPRPALKSTDVVAKLRHFSIISYAVPPERVRPHVHQRFELDTYHCPERGPVVWVSMVPFQDRDFHFVGLPWLRFSFGQTNYRTYVIDRRTGQRAVWFFGTSLDSHSIILPRNTWKLPWHRGRIRFDCRHDPLAGAYTRYRMRTSSAWAPVEIELQDSGKQITSLSGMSDLEGGLVALTHPFIGVYTRTTGGLGGYRVWHEPLQCTRGRILRARIGLFHRLGLVSYKEQQHPHSVLIQPETEFSVILPPTSYSEVLRQ